jgi:MFS transporter, OFA family, oxalate/formate antiporter
MPHSWRNRAVRTPFFYGWIIVVISMVAGFLGSGVSNITMSVLLKPITEDLGWSRTLLSSAVTIGSVAGGMLAPAIGPIADRLGPRYLLPIGAALFGAFVLGVGATHQPWLFYAAFVPARALAETLLTGVVPMTAVANWFYLKRPRAIGLVAMSVPLGSFALALIYQFIISNYGWRAAFMVLGIAVWLLVVIPGIFFLRRQPEDLGLLPDGRVSRWRAETLMTEIKNPEMQTIEQSWSLGEALRTSSMWLLVAASTLASLSTGGIAFHLVAYCTDVNIEPAIAVSALSLMALSGAFGSGIWGRLAEKYHPRRLSVVTILLSALSVAILTQVRIPLTAYVFAILFGLNARGGPVLLHVLLARYYGRRSFGAISSVLEPFHKGGLGLGALIAGAGFDLAGNYQLIFLIFLGNYLLSAFLTLLARQPQ